LAKKRKRNRATIGIDIGGTKTLFALLDDDFEVIAEETCETLGGTLILYAFLSLLIRRSTRDAGS